MARIRFVSVDFEGDLADVQDAITSLIATAIEGTKARRHGGEYGAAGMYACK